MDFLQAIKDRMPEYAKDIKLNLDSTIARSSLMPEDALGVALAASIVGKCHFCIGSHYALLKNEGWTTQQLRDVGRIAAVVNATAQVMAAEGA